VVGLTKRNMSKTKKKSKKDNKSKKKDSKKKELLEKVINNRTDIKYSGVPNVCFSLTDADDDREEDFSKQRKEFGFDDSETWCLMASIASFTIPRLERYIEITDGMFENSNTKECKQLLTAFKLLVRDDSFCMFDEKEKKKVEKGLNHFPKIFQGLWW
jgi:hypothetical protein